MNQLVAMIEDAGCGKRERLVLLRVTTNLRDRFARYYRRVFRNATRVADKRRSGGMALHYEIETEIEEDGRWIAEAIGLPGVIAYGLTQDEAISRVEALALRVIADRIDKQELPARGMIVSFGA